MNWKVILEIAESRDCSHLAVWRRPEQVLYSSCYKILQQHLSPVWEAAEPIRYQTNVISDPPFALNIFVLHYTVQKMHRLAVCVSGDCTSNSRVGETTPIQNHLFQKRLSVKATDLD